MQTSLSLKEQLGDLREQVKKIDEILWRIQNAKDEFDITDTEHRIYLACQRKEITVEKRIQLIKLCKEFRHGRAV